MIVNSGSCFNAIALKLITTLGMKLMKHSNTYKVTWIDTISIDVQERCEIPIQFAMYTDNVWCDILHMDVDHIILGRSWLFDLDVTIWTNQPLLVRP